MSLPESEGAAVSNEQAGARIAFFGGSFDPPHLGHLAVARAARGALHLDTVLFAPVGAQPLKPGGATAGFADRVAMTELAIAGERGFAISLADAPKPGGKPNYTLETLKDLRAGLGAAGALFCLMGADSFFGLRKWHRAGEIPFVAPLIVASRPGEPLHELQAALPEGLAMVNASGVERVEAGVEVREFQLTNGKGERAALYILPGLHVEISATEIRTSVGGNEDRAAMKAEANGALVPAPVEAYIRAHGLYR